MNSYQRLLWQEAKSDHDVFEHFREQGFPQCHSLHYLQMATEKIAKAYISGSGPPPKSHAGFRHFVRHFVCQRRQPKDRERIANLFSFTRFSDFQNWMGAVMNIVYGVEGLAPSLANDGPNPEYPWPHAAPRIAPVNHDFTVWHSLMSHQGRDLMRFIGIAIRRFPEYADT